MDKSKIPYGPYCYTIKSIDENGNIKTDVCPYWGKREDRPSQINGYCSFLNIGDWDDNSNSELWDQVKECGENIEYI